MAPSATISSSATWSWAGSEQADRDYLRSAVRADVRVIDTARTTPSDTKDHPCSRVSWSDISSPTGPATSSPYHRWAMIRDVPGASGRGREIAYAVQRCVCQLGGDRVRPMQQMRRAVNPISTGLTAWWCGIGPRRQVPVRPQQTIREAGTFEPPGRFLGTSSPGDWIVPGGQRPGWEWLPEHGAIPNLRAMPRWARVWYRTPFLDRYAYEWMWWHGGWWVLAPAEPPSAPPDGGVREPRRPRPVDRAGAAEYGESSSPIPS